PAAVEALLAAHAAALAADDDRVVRRGRRSLLTRLPHAGGAVIVKESRGRGAAARARAAFGNGVAALARDLPVAAPLAAVLPSGDRGFALARAIDDELPLHLVAHEAIGTAEPARVAAVTTAVLRLLAALIGSRFVHPDLSLKNLLLREGRDGCRVTLLDLDAARAGARWTTRRLARALAQLGDVPAAVLRKPARVRFVRSLLQATARPESVESLLRRSERLLARRRRIGAPPPTIAAGCPASLHVFGNWKWTGPAEPAVALAHAFAPAARLLLGPGPAGPDEQQLVPHARARGLDPRVAPALSKHWNPLRTGRGAAALARAGQESSAVLIVTHLDGDLAAAARARGALAPRPALLRCVHDAGPRRALARGLLRRADLLVTPTHGLARELERDLALPTYAVGVLETSVDRDRFAFTAEKRERGRARLALAAERPVFGIVARIQSHRRFELLLAAWRLLADRGAPPQLLIFGRGTEEAALVHEPIRRLGLEECVRVPGYQDGDAFVEALAACDAGLFMVPGTDVSCRAVREWMAMGRAVVALRRAPLPELIDDGKDGWLAEESAEGLAAMVRTAAEPARLAEAGARAAAKAVRRFDPRRIAAVARLLGRMAVLARPGAAADNRLDAQVLAAVRPGRLEAAIELARRYGFGADELVAFDPARSRDALLDLVALARRARPRLLLVEPSPDWDSGARAAMRRLAPEVAVLVAAGATAGALERAFPAVEIAAPEA
ncbi:MAG: glycosyltransferase, partial [Planctomycetes bacterium]|nr:glycosyltransferase [Planctomycetota bacterium]